MFHGRYFRRRGWLPFRPKRGAGTPRGWPPRSRGDRRGPETKGGPKGVQWPVGFTGVFFGVFGKGHVRRSMKFPGGGASGGNPPQPPAGGGSQAGFSAGGVRRGVKGSVFGKVTATPGGAGGRAWGRQGRKFKGDPKSGGENESEKARGANYQVSLDAATKTEGMIPGKKGEKAGGPKQTVARAPKKQGKPKGAGWPNCRGRLKANFPAAQGGVGTFSFRLGAGRARGFFPGQDRGKKNIGGRGKNQFPRQHLGRNGFRFLQGGRWRWRMGEKTITKKNRTARFFAPKACDQPGGRFVLAVQFMGADRHGGGWGTLYCVGGTCTTGLVGSQGGSGGKKNFFVGGDGGGNFPLIPGPRGNPLFVSGLAAKKKTPMVRSVCPPGASPINIKLGSGHFRGGAPTRGLLALNPGRGGGGDFGKKHLSGLMVKIPGGPFSGSHAGGGTVGGKGPEAGVWGKQPSLDGIPVFSGGPFVLALGAVGGVGAVGAAGQPLGGVDWCNGNTRAGPGLLGAGFY